MNTKRKFVIFRVFQFLIIFYGTANILHYLPKLNILDYNYKVGFIIIICNSWLILVIHELGHVMILVIKNINIRSIYLPFISFHFGEKVQCRISLAWFNEGLVIPEFPVCHNNLEYLYLKKIYMQFLLSGPIASIIYCILIICVTMIAKNFNPLLTGYYVILMFNCCIQSFFILNNCFKQYSINIGDIIAYCKVKESDFFFANYIYCCYFFSTEYIFKITECNYIKSIIIANLMSMNDEELAKNYALLDELIYRAITGLDLYFKDFIDSKIHSVLNNILDDLSSYATHSIDIHSTYIHALIYLITSCDERELALRLYINSEDILKQCKSPVCNYLYSQIKYLLRLETNKTQIIYPIQEFKKWNFYKQYYECEYIIWEKLDTSIS